MSNSTIDLKKKSALETTPKKIIKLANDLLRYEEGRAEKTRSLLLLLSEAKNGVKAKPIPVAKFSPSMDVEMVALSLESLFLPSFESGGLHISIKGFDEPSSIHHGSESFVTEIIVYDTKNKIAIEADFKNNECESWDELNICVYINGLNLTNLVDGESRGRKGYLIDDIDALFSKWLTGSFLTGDTDISDPHTPERANIMKALDFAISQDTQ